MTHHEDRVCGECLGSGKLKGALFQDGRPVPCDACEGTGILSEPPGNVHHVSDSDSGQTDER